MKKLILILAFLITLNPVSGQIRKTKIEAIDRPTQTENNSPKRRYKIQDFENGKLDNKNLGIPPRWAQFLYTTMTLGLYIIFPHARIHHTSGSASVTIQK